MSVPIISLCGILRLNFTRTETVLEKDKPERDRIVKGVMAKDLQSDSKSLKQKLDATGLQTKAKEEQVNVFFITMKTDFVSTYS